MHKELIVRGSGRLVVDKNILSSTTPFRVTVGLKSVSVTFEGGIEGRPGEPGKYSVFEARAVGERCKRQCVESVCHHRDAGDGFKEIRAYDNSHVDVHNVERVDRILATGTSHIGLVANDGVRIDNIVAAVTGSGDISFSGVTANHTKLYITGNGDIDGLHCLMYAKIDICGHGVVALSTGKDTMVNEYCSGGGKINVTRV